MFGLRSDDGQSRSMIALWTRTDKVACLDETFLLLIVAASLPLEQAAW
jgi:hypothetical protein